VPFAFAGAGRPAYTIALPPAGQPALRLIQTDAPEAPHVAQRSPGLTGGELSRLVEAFDWSATTLGPIGSWPQSLKTTVDIVLHSPVPLVLLWGPDGIMIYNDAYAVFAGGRHPALLGCKVLEGWPEAHSPIATSTSSCTATARPKTCG
jgi:hypothetical protein